MGPTRSRLPHAFDLCVAGPSPESCIVFWEHFLRAPGKLERVLGMASRRAEEPEVLKPKELRGPEAVGLREYLRGSGMGPSPNISRTVMLKKYRMYSMWFYRWNQAQWVGLKERVILDSTKRSSEIAGTVL